MSGEINDLAALQAAVERYMSRAQQNGDCLVGSQSQRRYGLIGYGGGKSMSAHRASYIVHHGPIPDGMLVRHSCDTSLCVNPDHLLVGTHLDNMRDMWDRGRHPVGFDLPCATVPPETIREAIAEYVQGGVSQKVVASRYGVPQSTFSNWLLGSRRLDVGETGYTGVKRPQCGTFAAYSGHRRRGERPCDPCIEARRAHERAYRKRRRAEGVACVEEEGS